MTIFDLALGASTPSVALEGKKAHAWKGRTKFNIRMRPGHLRLCSDDRNRSATRIRMKMADSHEDEGA